MANSRYLLRCPTMSEPAVCWSIQVFMLKRVIEFISSIGSTNIFFLDAPPITAELMVGGEGLKIICSSFSPCSIRFLFWRKA
ncbi:hypothetical protein I3843_10G159800 [Carya illinoinensis]|uniref:Uncharacterized protein n=1 Tax=Carya illinoinensis TaxID=32201 RepID=A0A922E074_CARIL|nr:hypothetical protein I3760_10G168000 [Carya illinoinensis]KAG2686281.1 hypothetical protein I3760_10G168000 [Carya illinoinensis]KAG6693389.1 hypothetical protein I3842_10G165200 [Carya illinoinensis]KAG6693390.1 hypothetical protein I3842_10G165200 [Carya illinoinensis]KAG6693391.1 hypothetical protein I3842_10G165200 [Carya illinoinensis]